MLVVDNGDAIRGIAEVATKLDFTVNGYVGTTATQLADGQMATSETDLYLSGANATVVTSIAIVNTDSAARTFTLYLKATGGTRAISPISLDLPIGYSFYTDGQRAIVMSTGGEVVQTYSLHAPSHTSGNTDPIKLDDLATPDDNTDLDASTSEHGLLLKLDNSSTNFLNGQGAWAAPAGGTGIATGTYSGDGATSQGITGVGFQPKLVWITRRYTNNTVFGDRGISWTTDQIVDDNASGMALLSISGGNYRVDSDAIISLDADGFTVDDTTADADPNKNGITYNFWAIGP